MAPVDALGDRPPLEPPSPSSLPPRSLNDTAPLISAPTRPLRPLVGLGQTVYIRRAAGDAHAYPAIVWHVHDDNQTIDATVFGPWWDGTEKIRNVGPRPLTGEWPVRTWGYTP